MKKLYILAALLMATTSAQAGGITFQITASASVLKRRATATPFPASRSSRPATTARSAMSISRAWAPRKWR